MSMINAYREVGSCREAAAMCDCDPKTVKRALERLEAGDVPAERTARARNYGVVVDVVAARVAKTAGRISAKRLLPEARAAAIPAPRSATRLPGTPLIMCNTTPRQRPRDTVTTEALYIIPAFS
jgi:hypothetical protein